MLAQTSKLVASACQDANLANLRANDELFNDRGIQNLLGKLCQKAVCTTVITQKKINLPVPSGTSGPRGYGAESI